MEVEIYNMCALENWPKIVELAEGANVIFNMIDVGEYFDAAVQALCMKRKIPLIMGGTFSQTYTVDCFLPGASSCFVCSDDNLKKDILDQIVPTKIGSLPNLNFIPKNVNPIG
jgi:molybdopterin/thiamine biosynthesis adenylyltransferase